jgi:hypothetical protein
LLHGENMKKRWRLSGIGGSGSDIRIRILPLAWVLLLGGCASDGLAKDASNDVQADGGGDDLVDGRGTDVMDLRPREACRLPLDAAQPFSSCLPTFDDDSWKTQACDGPSLFRPQVTEQVCAGYRSREFDYGTHRWSCYYDPATGMLVAAEFINDIDSFCDASAYLETLGDVPVAGTCAAPTSFRQPCISPDGGSDGSADGSSP